MSNIPQGHDRQEIDRVLHGSGKKKKKGGR